MAIGPELFQQKLESISQHIFKIYWLHFDRDCLDTKLQNDDHLRDIFKIQSNIVDVAFRNNPMEVFFGKSVLTKYSRFTEKYPCRSVISINPASLFKGNNHKSYWEQRHLSN